MKRTEHTFTRAGAVYDCVAKADSFAGVSGARRRPIVTGRTWWATAFGAEYVTLRFTGEEFGSTTSRHTFEDAVVDAVADQLPLALESPAAGWQVTRRSSHASAAQQQSTVCPLCRGEDGVTGAGIHPRVTEIHCRRCGDFLIDDVWMAWADSTMHDTIEAREAFARHACEANASGLLLELTEAARGTPKGVRALPPRQLREL